MQAALYNTVIYSDSRSTGQQHALSKNSSNSAQEDSSATAVCSRSQLLTGVYHDAVHV
jgi:hypothetical protein